jgi:hypothetical protein
VSKTAAHKFPFSRNGKSYQGNFKNTTGSLNHHIVINGRDEFRSTLQRVKAYLGKWQTSGIKTFVTGNKQNLTFGMHL